MLTQREGQRRLAEMRRRAWQYPKAEVVWDLFDLLEQLGDGMSPDAGRSLVRCLRDKYGVPVDRT